MEIDKYRHNKIKFILLYGILTLVFVTIECFIGHLYLNSSELSISIYLFVSISFYILLILVSISVTFFFFSFFIKFKEVSFYNHVICVYAGFKEHKLFIDYQLKDVLNQFSTFTPITLRSFINFNCIEAIISTSNQITIKVNGVLYLSD